MKKVLFICTHNSARSQMAEALLKQSCGENKTKAIFPFMRERPGFNYVISVCDEDAREPCPTFPAGARYVQCSFPDPSKFTGTDAEKPGAPARVRDAIRARIQAWCAKRAPLTPHNFIRDSWFAVKAAFSCVLFQRAASLSVNDNNIEHTG
jgi:arsenate reductase (thioredoxin)